MNSWEDLLSRQGHRVTDSRRAVMRVLTEAERPLSPQTIYEIGRVFRPRLGLVTVYRTLDLLEGLDLVRRVHRGDGCHGYVLSSPGHRHVVLCDGCGRAEEFVGADDLDDLIHRVEGHTGYRIDAHLLQLAGLCPDCRA